jgi:hypothetical protein
LDPAVPPSLQIYLHGRMAAPTEGKNHPQQKFSLVKADAAETLDCLCMRGPRVMIAAALWIEGGLRERTHLLAAGTEDCMWEDWEENNSGLSVENTSWEEGGLFVRMKS